MSGGNGQSAWARQEYYTIRARFLRPDVRPPRIKSKAQNPRCAYVAVLDRAYTPITRLAPLSTSAKSALGTMIATASSQKAFLGTGLQTQQPK